MIAIEAALNMSAYDMEMTQFLRARYTLQWSRQSIMMRDIHRQDEKIKAQRVAAAYSDEERQIIYEAWRQSFLPGTPAAQTPEYRYEQHYKQFTTTK